MRICEESPCYAGFVKGEKKGKWEICALRKFLLEKRQYASTVMENVNLRGKFMICRFCKRREKGKVGKICVDKIPGKAIVRFYSNGS